MSSIKRLMISVVIVVVIITTSILGIWNIKNVHDQVMLLSESAQHSIDVLDIKKAEEFTEKLNDFWTQRHRILALYVRHNDVDEISKYISELEQLLKHGDYSEYSSNISYIQLLITDLWETEIPTIMNIF